MDVELNEKGLYPIYQTWHTPFWETRWFLGTIYSLLGFVFIVGFFLLFRYFLKRRKKSVVTPWNHALKMCKNLESSMPSGKEFYISISQILKQYLYRRFGYDVVGKTDNEVLSYIQNISSQKKLSDRLEDIFQGSILIKYADQKAAKEQITLHLKNTISLIKSTIPEKKQGDI